MVKGDACDSSGAGAHDSGCRSRNTHGNYEPWEAEDFLTGRIRPLLINLQSHWTDCGIVFGFSAHPKAFEETSLEEEVLFRRRDSKTVRLSEGLWDGSATANVKRVVREGNKDGEETIIGYYVHASPEVSGPQSISS